MVKIFSSLSKTCCSHLLTLLPLFHLGFVNLSCYYNMTLNRRLHVLLVKFI